MIIPPKSGRRREPEQVAAWQEEERAAAQHLAALERERTAEQERQRIARARDSIKQWLILAPIALANGQSGAEGLEIEQIAGEGQLRPKAGETASIVGGELKWRQVALTNEVIDFNALLGHKTTQSVAYAVCYLRSEAEQRGLQMLVGSDDEAKIYLNGKQVYKTALPRPLYAEEDKVPDITLNAGLNVLVFKVVNETWRLAGVHPAHRCPGQSGQGDQRDAGSKGEGLALNPNREDARFQAAARIDRSGPGRVSRSGVRGDAALRQRLEWASSILFLTNLPAVSRS